MPVSVGCPVPSFNSSFPSGENLRTVWPTSSVHQTTSPGPIVMPCGRRNSPSPQDPTNVPSALEDDHRMFAAAEDERAVARIDGDGHDLDKRPAGGKFRPVGNGSVPIIAAAKDHGDSFPSRGTAA